MKYARVLLGLWLAASAGAAGFEALEEAEDLRQAEAPALKEAASSTEPAMRARAALAWGRIQKPQSIEPLLGLLGDPDLSVRLEAVFALGQLGWLAEASGGREAEISAKLAPLAEAAEEPMRIAAVEALGKIALSDAPRLVLPSLKDKSPAVRAEAALALFRYRLVERLRSSAVPPPILPDLPQDAMDALLKLRKDHEPLVRRNVAYFFARVKDVRGLDAVTSLSKDRDPWVRAFAVMGLGKMGDPKGGSAARDALWDPELPVRVAAVQSLGALQQGEMLPAELAKDPSFHVRASLASAVKDEALLMRLWADESVEVRAAALQALVSQKKGAALELLKQGLAASSPVVRSASVEASDGIPEAAELVRSAAEDPDELVRASALGVLGKIDTPEAFEAIKKALGSAGVAERGTAVEALRERKEPEALDLLAKAYQDGRDGKWIEVRETIVDILMERSEPIALETLRQALADPAPSVASKAREALTAKGLAKDLPAAPAPAAPSSSPYKSERFAKPPVVVLETTRGNITIQCYPQDAPVHVANFVGLVRKGFYDGLLWHRVVSNFVIQGGDPLNTGWGDAGYTLRAEVNHRPYLRGALGMPRAQGFDTGSCQIFFSLIPTPHLEGQYTVFGQVTEGLDVLDKIERGDKIIHARVVE